MRQRLALSILAVVALFIAPSVNAQTRGYVVLTAGYGSLGDDEGGLGSGEVFGGGGGWNIGERLSIEGAVTKARHERLGSLSWVGDPLTVTARVLYRFHDADAPVRVFFGAGGGYFRYPGTFTETLYDSPTAAPRRESRDWLVSGRAIELGGGIDINIGSRLFVRPEAWMTVANVDRVFPAPEAPYAMPRIAVSGGLRF